MGNNIILIGMPGCGKSTIGVVLAKMLGMDFLDVDLRIQSQQGKKLQDILAEIGPARFLELEAKVLCLLDCAHTVIAPGGSAVLTKAGAEHLRQLGTMVYLKVPLAMLEKRLWNLTSRGIAMKKDQSIANLYEQRTPYYEKYADLTVEEGATLAETVQKVANAILAAKDA